MGYKKLTTSNSRYINLKDLKEGDEIEGLLIDYNDKTWEDGSVSLEIILYLKATKEIKSITMIGNLADKADGTPGAMRTFFDRANAGETTDSIYLGDMILITFTRVVVTKQGRDFRLFDVQVNDEKFDALYEEGQKAYEAWLAAASTQDSQ